MAVGDFVVFDQFLTDLGNKIHDMDSDTFKLGLIKSAANGGDDPAATDTAPHWNGTGTTDYSTSEVTAGGNYSTGGSSLASPSWAVTSNIVKWDVNNLTITQNASNPTNARWGIVYNSTDTNKRAIGYLDLGSDQDLSGGDFTYTVPANGLFRIGVGTIT